MNIIEVMCLLMTLGIIMLYLIGFIMISIIIICIYKLIKRRRDKKNGIERDYRKEDKEDGR